VAPIQQASIHFSMGKGIRIMNSATRKMIIKYLSPFAGQPEVQICILLPVPNGLFTRNDDEVFRPLQ
jgi:hypothetical protein